MDNYNRGGHSKYSLKVHLIFVTKYRKKIFKSSTQMWTYHKEYLSKHYWKQKILWSDGYFACSIGRVSQDIIEKYIQNQG